ncbi:hypothetical protein, partial [Butyrivibrio sp.]|uniref:hypothetical protein n=1 Tax=Butyrivibrio sp. TaxID=28121 RepID=UPI0025C0690C
MSNDHKPLPEHTKIDYDECCALLILKELFPKEYSTLVIADKPDLQGNDVGIEVTIAGNKKHLEAFNICVKANNSDNLEKKHYYIERLKQLGIKYTDGFQVWPGVKPSYEYVKKAVESKVKKLNSGGYKHFDRYELFIFTDTWMTESIITEAMSHFCNASVFDSYKKIFVLEKGYKLHVFTDTGCQIIEIDISEQSERNIRARRIVE